MEAFGGLAGIGVLFGGLGFAYAQFRAGSGKAKDELIQTLKDTAIAEREKAAQLAKEKVEQSQFHQTQINQLNEKIGKLQGLYEESKDRNREYLAILQGRDPDQKKFMDLMSKAIVDGVKAHEEAQRHMRDTSQVLDEIKTFMKIMSGEVAKANLFNQEVVIDTAHDEGKLLKKRV